MINKKSIWRKETDTRNIKRKKEKKKKLDKLALFFNLILHEGNSKVTQKVEKLIYTSRDSNPGSSVGNARWWPLHYWCSMMVPRPGFEPGTTASSGQRSPTELPGQAG